MGEQMFMAHRLISGCSAFAGIMIVASTFVGVNNWHREARAQTLGDCVDANWVNRNLTNQTVNSPDRICDGSGALCAGSGCQPAPPPPVGCETCIRWQPAADLNKKVGKCTVFHDKKCTYCYTTTAQPTILIVCAKGNAFESADCTVRITCTCVVFQARQVTNGATECI